MSEAINREVYERLTLDEKIQLVQDIWDDIARTPRDVGVDPALIAEAERRLEEHRRNPGECLTWEAARRQIENDL